MQLINSSSFSILDARTVVNILNTKLIQTNKYPHIRSRFYDLKKTSDSKLVFFIKSQFASNIEKIYDNIIELFSTDVLLGGKKIFVSGEDSTALGFDKKIVLQRSVKKVEIFFKTSKSSQNKIPELLRPGILNEEYFVSKINDQIQKIKNAKKEVGLPSIFDPTLNIVLYENNVKQYTISSVKSIERVGQLRQKEDVVIETTNNNKIRVSLKKENFSFWGSASLYSPAKKILDYLVNSNLIKVSNNNGRGILTDFNSGNNIIGVRTIASIGEIKKYCFGEDLKKIDYILIQSFNPGDFKEMRTSGSSGTEYKFELNSSLVYTQSAKDIIRMKNNVYLTIVPSSKNSSLLLPEYPGFRIQFETANSSSKYYEPNLSNASLGRI